MPNKCVGWRRNDDDEQKETSSSSGPLEKFQRPNSAAAPPVDIESLRGRNLPSVLYLSALIEEHGEVKFRCKFVKLANHYAGGQRNEFL